MHDSHPPEGPHPDASPRVTTVDPARENDEAIRARSESGLPALKRADLVWAVLLAAWVITSRIPYISDHSYTSKDGPLYIHSLALDRSYDVPMPGNIGFVVLGKLANLVWPDPLNSYAAVCIALTVVGAVSSYLLGSLFLPRPLAAATAFGLSANAILWWYGEVISSYLVWFAVMPTLGWFGARFVLGRRVADLLGATLTLGVGMMLRPDLLFFGSFLWLGCVALGRPSWKVALGCVGLLGVACACWFFGTAAVLGGVGTYLERVRAKHDWDRATFSFAQRGLVDGLLRNGSKYALFLVWGTHIVLIPATLGLFRQTFSLRKTWRGILLASLWVGPSLYFSFLVFAGNAGLIFPLLPLVYLGGALGLVGWFGREGVGKATTAMAALGLLSVVQFVGVPLLRETNQRDVILNVTFLRFSAAGVEARYNRNLDDYGMSSSLASVVRQLRRPEPIPTIPPRLGDDDESRARHIRLSAQ